MSLVTRLKTSSQNCTGGQFVWVDISANSDNITKRNSLQFYKTNAYTDIFQKIMTLWMAFYFILLFRESYDPDVYHLSIPYIHNKNWVYISSGHFFPLSKFLYKSVVIPFSKYS